MPLSDVWRRVVQRRDDFDFQLLKSASAMELSAYHRPSSRKTAGRQAPRTHIPRYYSQHEDLRIQSAVRSDSLNNARHTLTLTRVHPPSDVRERRLVGRTEISVRKQLTMPTNCSDHSSTGSLSTSPFRTNSTYDESVPLLLRLYALQTDGADELKLVESVDSADMSELTIVFGYLEASTTRKLSATATSRVPPDFAPEGAFDARDAVLDKSLNHCHLFRQQSNFVEGILLKCIESKRKYMREPFLPGG
uniref:Uncharacterized protein n=1 Tax=Plectus sambesii TaxID=2011161 RepID=A0A914WQ33_9BILA